MAVWQSSTMTLSSFGRRALTSPCQLLSFYSVTHINECRTVRATSCVLAEQSSSRSCSLTNCLQCSNNLTCRCPVVVCRDFNIHVDDKRDVYTVRLTKLNAAAQVVSGTKKYARGLILLLHSELHWLDVADWVTYKLGVTVYKCLHGQAPDYLFELCGRSSCWTTASLFHQLPSTCCSMVSARHIRPSHLCCRWTNNMELVPWQLAWTRHTNRLLLSHAEEVPLWTVLCTLSTLEALFLRWCDV